MGRERTDLQSKLLKKDLNFNIVKLKLQLEHMDQEMEMKSTKSSLECEMLELQNNY